MTTTLTEAFHGRVRSDLDLIGTVLAIGEIPYGRPSERTAAGVITDWRGTCSTKHLLLARLVAERWPHVPVVLWHRVYTVRRAWARARWGPRVAANVPARGLVDVHTFATADVGFGEATIDVTFPVAAWDGTSDMILACGPGVDHLAGTDPIASKSLLVTAHCDQSAREGFIAALTRAAE
jgi:hypothetical protein